MIKSTEIDTTLIKAEDFLKDLGFEKPKLSEHQRILQIGLLDHEIAKAIEQRDLIVEEIKSLGYRFVTLDLCVQRISRGEEKESLDEPDEQAD